MNGRGSPLPRSRLSGPPSPLLWRRTQTANARETRRNADRKAMGNDTRGMARRKEKGKQRWPLVWGLPCSQFRIGTGIGIGNKERSAPRTLVWELAIRAYSDEGRHRYAVGRHWRGVENCTIGSIVEPHLESLLPTPSVG